jgi:hypothetical protein
MPFSATWHNLLNNGDELPSDAALLTPLWRGFLIRILKDFL